MLRSMNEELLRISLQDIAVGVVCMVLFSLLALFTARFSEKRRQVCAAVCYLVLQLGFAAEQIVAKITLAGVSAVTPTTFLDWVLLAGPFVRAFIFAAAGYFYLKGCQRLLDDGMTFKQTV